MYHTIKNILLPTNFSETGNTAIKIAANLCKQNNAVLHLLHVVENSAVVSDTEPAAAITSEIDHQATELLYNIYETIMRDFKIAVQIYMPTGIAAYEICKLAEEMNFGLVVMGTKNASEKNNLFFGSTIQNVVQNLQKPLLTIPADFEAEGFHKILFPVRPVAEVTEKFNFIRPFLTKKSNVHVAALCVEGDEESLLTYKYDFHEIIHSLKHLGIFCTKDFYTCENIAQKVVGISKLVAADLIVINDAARNKLAEWLTEKYTQQVIQYSLVPVLSYRSSNNAKEQKNKQILIGRDENHFSGFHSID